MTIHIHVLRRAIHGTTGHICTQFNLDGGEVISANGEHLPALTHIVPHARTLRKAREQVQQMVKNAVSPRGVTSYLNRWTL